MSLFPRRIKKYLKLPRANRDQQAVGPQSPRGSFRFQNERSSMSVRWTRKRALVSFRRDYSPTGEQLWEVVARVAPAYIV